jgi:hypothetical protein
MKSLLSFTGLATLLSLLVNVQAVTNSTNGPSCGVAKADDSYFSVVGVQGTGVHPRQELRELQKDTELWNIFIQAFARFQAMDQDQKISYFQVAGTKSVLFLYNSTNSVRDTRSAVPEVGQRERDIWSGDEGVLSSHLQHVRSLAPTVPRAIRAGSPRSRGGRCQ